MHTGFTAQVKSFDTFLGVNYDKLLIDALSIFKHHEHVEDYLHDVLIYTRDRITRSGFTGNDFYRYVWSSLSGKFLTVKRIEKQKRKDLHYQFPTDDISDEYNEMHFRSEVESMLIDAQEENSSRLEYHEDLEFHTKRVFQFVDLRYPPAEASVFKEYYMEPKCTYKKIARRTGLSIAFCQQAITPIKKDLKENYITWLKSYGKKKKKDNHLAWLKSQNKKKQQNDTRTSNSIGN